MMVSWVPSPIHLGSVSLSPEVARHKSPREPSTPPYNRRCFWNIATVTCRPISAVPGLAECPTPRRLLLISLPFVLVHKSTSEVSWEFRYVSLAEFELFGAVRGSVGDLCRATL